MANLSLQIVVLLAVFYIVQLFYSPTFTDLLQLSPQLVLSQPWRLVSSVFLHDPADITHILLNSFALIMFGSVLERVITKKDYLMIFFGAGILGGLLYWLTYVLGIIGPLPALGASGSIYGILGALAVLLPDMTIMIFFFFPLKMRYAAIFWFFLELVGITQTSVSGIASAGHLGGLIFGLLYAYFVIKKRPLIVSPSAPQPSSYYQPPPPAW